MKICEECESTNNIHEAHVSYEPEIKKDLCASCHGKMKSKARENRFNRLIDANEDDHIIIGKGGLSRITKNIRTILNKNVALVYKGANVVLLAPNIEMSFDKLMKEIDFLKYRLKTKQEMLHD